EDEEAVGAGLADEPDGAHAALAERLDQLVALDRLRGLSLRDGWRRRRPPHRAAHGGLDERRGDGAEGGEPYVEHRELALTDGARDEGRDARGVLRAGARLVALARAVERLHRVG